MSVEAPVAQGTMTVICLVGQSLAAPLAGSAGRSSKKTIRRKIAVPADGLIELQTGYCIQRSDMIFI
jgi:hypothetical protein